MERPSRLLARRLRLAGPLLLLLVAPTRARAQGFFERLELDKLQITSLGLAVGRIMPSQVRPTNLVAVQADYGNISPSWRVVFGASYWESRFNDGVIQAFVDSLHKSVSDPAAQVIASPVRLYDVTFNGEVRFTPNYSGEIKPFVGAGLAAHVINAEGALIKGTFVERSLDDISTGVFIAGGISLRLLPHFGIEGTARADLLSGFRSTQARAGATYYFGHVRGARRGGDAAQENGGR